jgi:ABC-type multidrug transport system fused ATPase/permease subunit
MLKNPSIIILDEPTSALDSFSEEQITKAMNNLFVWRIVIVIAHRLQTVRHAHNIFVMEDSQIKESWTHDDLIKKWWIYAKMLELQSGF